MKNGPRGVRFSVYGELFILDIDVDLLCRLLCPVDELSDRQKEYDEKVVKNIAYERGKVRKQQTYEEFFNKRPEH